MILELGGKHARERGLHALVDDDFEAPLTTRGNPFAYYAIPARCKIEKWYAARTGRRWEKSTMYLHRDVWKWKYGKEPDAEIDHINGISLDCRSCNLREASRNLQSHNLETKGNTKYRGVHDDGNCYMASVQSKGKNYINRFPRTESGLIAAANHVDCILRKIYGKAARLNFPD